MPNNETKGQDLINLLSLQVLLVWTVKRELRGSFHRDCANNAIGGLERIRNQPLPAAYDLFIRCIIWAFSYLLFIRLDSMHDPGGALIGFLCLFGFVLAERLGAFTENPFEDGLYGLPINRICATISGNLLLIDHPLATPPQNQAQSQASLIWT